MTLFRNDNEDDGDEADSKTKKSKKAAKQEAAVSKDKYVPIYLYMQSS